MVIPTLTGWPTLEDTLPALLAALGPDDEVIVVGDQAAPALPLDVAARCRVIANRGRRGFGPTCNAGARAASGELLLFLNDDVVVGREILVHLAAAIADERVAAAGPNLVSVRLGRSESGTEIRLVRGVLDVAQHPIDGTGSVQVPYLCGAAVAVPSTLFQRVGGFDERLAPYFWEDVELSLRLAEFGLLVVACGAKAEHRHGLTVNREPQARRRAVYERNRLLVTWRHLRGASWLRHLAWLPLRLVASVFRDRAVVSGFIAALRVVAGWRSDDAHRY